MAARPQSRAGDVTGREREKQQQEHAKEIKAGAERLTMVNPPPATAPDQSVVDLTGGDEGFTGARMLTLEEVIAEGLTEITDVQSQKDIDVDSLDDGRTVPGMEKPQATRPEEPQPTQPTADAAPALPGGARHGGVGVKEATTVAPRTAEALFKILRVNEDLEEVTIGKGNTFTFLQNQYYKVTPSVYDHLDEKGFVYH